MGTEETPADRAAAARLLGAVFERSRHGMLVADDARRYIDANPAVCRLTGMARERLLRLRVDDLTPEELRADVPRLWRRFLEEGTQAGRYELVTADGTRVSTDYSATANVAPGQHLSIFSLLGDLPAPELEPGDDVARGDPITPREREVLELVALGSNTRQIADALTMSPDTARTHARNAMRKLGARNRPHAVALALKQRLIDV